MAKKSSSSFCVQTLLDPINYVRQFSTTRGLVECAHVRIDATLPEKTIFECGTHEHGGETTVCLPKEFGCIGKTVVNVSHLSDFLRVLPSNAPVTVRMNKNGDMVVSSGCATKTLPAYLFAEDARNKVVNGEWRPLPPLFIDYMDSLERQRIRDIPILMSDDGRLFYRDSVLRDMLIIENTGLPDFKLSNKYVNMMLSCEPTKIVVDSNRVGFSCADRTMFAPLVSCKAPPIGLLLEKTRAALTDEPTTLILDATSLRDACKVLATENDPCRMTCVTIQANNDNITMSCSYTECVVVGSCDKDSEITVSYTALQQIVDVGFDVDGKISVAIPKSNDKIYLQKGDLTYISSAIRKIS